ncbi:hypothetical protein QBC40DRAFT_20543 [Triangularia verruculosa]|uniref:Uncharacterized protein n=1 Tax=Triangularia verruculosa TaxID=2587418 RepID=A0AAN6XTL5_9PEZI|nr:hypothetical protein QBC40DRAFT_20543 [Triangularia verruculosa]
MASNLKREKPHATRRYITFPRSGISLPSPGHGDHFAPLPTLTPPSKQPREAIVRHGSVRHAAFRIFLLFQQLNEVVSPPRPGCRSCIAQRSSRNCRLIRSKEEWPSPQLLELYVWSIGFSSCPGQGDGSMSLVPKRRRNTRLTQTQDGALDATQQTLAIPRVSAACVGLRSRAQQLGLCPSSQGPGFPSTWKAKVALAVCRCRSMSEALLEGFN